MNLEVDFSKETESKGQLKISFPSGVDKRMDHLSGDYIFGIYPGGKQEFIIEAEYKGSGVKMIHDDITIITETFNLSSYPDVNDIEG